MIDGLPKKLLDLEDFLLSDAVGDDAMLLSELDGFLAGVIACPEMILPSEWLPVVWGEEEPVFDSLEQAQTVNGLIMGHYNDLVRDLERGRYRPVYDIDNGDDSIIWETWIEGFWEAATLRPKAWFPYIADAADKELQQALFVMGRLVDLASPPDDFKPMEGDEELVKLAPELIPFALDALHRARIALAGAAPRPANQNHPKVGRNDPCPCGSGKKFKKCCGA